MSFPGGSVVKNLPANAGDMGSIPGSGRSPGEGNGNTFQYSCLENPMDRGAWWAAVHGVAKSWTQLSDFHFHVCVCMELNHSAVDLKHCKSTTLEAHSCLFLCDPMECSLPGSTVHGMLQARVLEWVAIPFSGGSFQPGIEPRSPALQADSLPAEPPGKPN